MMKKIVQASSIWMLFLLGACTGSPGYHVDKKQEFKISEFTDDIKIPSGAWDLLEFKSSEGSVASHGEGEGHKAPPAEGHSESKSEGKSEGHGAAPAEGHSEGHSAVGKSMVFSEVSVILAQKNPGIIKGEVVKIELPKGGGNIDLSQFVTGKKGSFYVGFDFPQFEGASAKKIVFVSGTKKRKIGGQIFGSGCNQYFDISDKFLKEMKGEGLKVNTTQERYLSVMGGTFLFSAKKDNEVHLAQVTFKNSLFPSLFCEEH